MSTINFSPCSHSEHLSKDIEYRRLFSEPLTKPGGTLSYEGYLRAIQLYGREDLLVNSHKVHRYDRWVKSNPELHRTYQQQAIRDGYNPTGGSSNAFTGVYYPNPPLGGPSLNRVNSPHTPHRQTTQNEITEEMVGRRTPRNSSGQFAPAEGVFADYRGNVEAKAGESSRNAIGAAENALVLAEVVKNFLDKGVTPELRQKATSILTTMGGTQGLTTGLNIIIGEQSPELAPSSIDSVLRTAHAGRSGSGSGSARGTPRFNDTPIPLNLTGSLSARKRKSIEVVDIESDEDLAQFEEPAGQTRDGIPTLPRPFPAGPLIISDSIASGNGRKAIYSLVVADELMVFLDKNVAQTFGGLLCTLRKRLSESLPLSAAARMAGIDKSLVMSFDMPLCIPNPGSTALSAYISVVSEMDVFHQDTEMRSLARETVLSMRKQDYRPTAGLPVRFLRETTQAESWVPMEVMADKLTYLGEARKPLDTVNTWRRPQVISASNVRSLPWDNYDQIGETPAEDN
ncbi:uncharacterized protein FFUJ_01885 [Fusarium fujikuroi IMI 58289]|uniref:Uncharacterized protein n=1 Tax=Gibberella fujikuroi (strain CBS 195.34 / IMI 58289 / NRRL A-6831) TaxID=1279085 RepID=S0DHV7_GIBF5|nr:uncharacterized protein FFUJ_01885 [Fusarium fujikuroi IMI 58289]KLP00675.1 uncharacterized protein LW94_11207 [Fusarium fujikuroi]CCT61640.1 uncharacterized protein FFUJ_01885 [Fusarium fujikuroi IMI 58289]SCO12487.1 uncharacterized protein FFM5_10310 [Fusarium fujikuroi]SCO27337.1 uncharacterized protein FFMR_00216 [Fusarium fujikuroi]